MECFIAQGAYACERERERACNVIVANSPDKLFVTNDDVWADINISIQCRGEGGRRGRR